MNKIKKAFIIILSLIFSVQSGLFNIVYAQNKNSKHPAMNINDKKDVFKDSNWLNLVKIWKSLNDKDYNKGSNINYNALKQTGENAIKLIENLQKANLLKEDEINFLKELINQRIRFLQYSAGFIECYKMTLLGGEIVKKREDLESRYEILQKLYAENKIKSDTFEKTKEQILEDMNFIEKNTDKKKLSKNYLDLLMYLNK